MSVFLRFMTYITFNNWFTGAHKKIRMATVVNITGCACSDIEK